MKKEVKILKKLNGLLKQLSCPHYLHHFGPKKYKFVHHVCALLLKETLKCSFRRISKLLELFGIKVPTYSALCKSRKRIPLAVWQNMLTLTAGLTSGKVAIDGTGFSRTNPNFHYIKRIDRKKPIKRFGKLSALFDLVTKKFLKLKVRSKPQHDIKDAKLLLRHQKGIKRFYGDRGYDAEHLHHYCLNKSIQTIIKPRKYSKKG